MKPFISALFAVFSFIPVVPAAETPAADRLFSPFGIGSCHSNNYSTEANARWIPQMVAIGITNHRTCHTGWSAVEPAAGKWTWDALDRQVDYLEGQHLAFGGILYGNPDWNQAGGGFSLPVNNLADWSKYVTEVVKHANGRIKDWEVWNEPPNGTRKDQTPADYARIVVAAYDSAKAVDPACRVGLAAKSVHVNYLEQVIRAGANDHFDYRRGQVRRSQAAATVEEALAAKDNGTVLRDLGMAAMLMHRVRYFTDRRPMLSTLASPERFREEWRRAECPRHRWSGHFARDLRHHSMA